MPNVVSTSLFRHPARALHLRSYGQKFAWRAHRGPLVSKEQPTLTNEDETMTLRVRPNADGKERTLPLPPVMDPIALAAKERYKKPKTRRQRKSKWLSPFSRALEANPYAQALATTVRCCAFTRARLPMHFLQPFSAQFRFERGRLKGSIGAEGASPTHAEDKADSPVEGNQSDAVKSKIYLLNNHRMITAAGRRKRNVHSVVSERMKEGYEKRARALSAQIGSSVKVADEWVWEGSEQQSKEILVDAVVEAFKAYYARAGDWRYLISRSKLKDTDYLIIADPLEVRPWSESIASADDDSLRIPLDEAGEDVYIPAYDFAKLGLTGKLASEELGRDRGLTELAELDWVGILQLRRTVKLHLALQRLALFLGERGACEWIVVKREDWQLHGPPGLGWYRPIVMSMPESFSGGNGQATKIKVISCN